MKFQPDIWKLLRKDMSVAQLAGYAVANVVGLAVILAGILFYCDTADSADSDSYFSNDYIVISKKVNGLGFEPVAFSKEEVEALEAQPWVRRTGRFTSSQFAVNAAVEMGGRGMSTYLFFESVPDDFFDIKPRDWTFDPAERFVPIVLSKDYLTLYNFGFAIPQGLPQVSEELIGAIPVRLRISGEGMTPEYFDASIVGFSSRLNTIAVPQSFMDWANSRFATGRQPDPSRLIVEVDRMAASGMTRYFDDAGIEVAGDKSESGKISDFLGLVSGVVTANGIVISLLALFILLLSIFLLLQKSRGTLRNLVLLGYPAPYLARYYETVVIAANVLVAAVAFGIAICCRGVWHGQLAELGLGGSSILPAVLTAILYPIAVSSFNIVVIRRRLSGL